MTTKSGKRRKLYSDEDMCLALNDIKNEGISISESALRHNVPRMTLSDKIKGKVPELCKYGRETYLASDEEDTLVNYITYMANQRYPLTRDQVMRFAHSIALKTGKACFKNSGPSLKWWRGFRKRHPELSLRRTEFIDHGRVGNASQETIDDYFKVLEDTMIKANVTQKPHLIYNCDEASINLNKSAKKVMVPKSNKHCHSVARATGQHITVLCCVSAAGNSIPPLTVFKKGLPVLRNLSEQGPASGTYASTESGFMDSDLYVQWFQQNFLKHAPSERPLLLLQDGASAHLSVELIETAIANSVYLLCFPPKLTHILQPLDVGIYKKMKAELSSTLHSMKFLRGDNWIGKAQFPGVFRHVYDKTFTPATIRSAFKTCGIYPLNKDAVNSELIVHTLPKLPEKNKTNEHHVTDLEADLMDISIELPIETTAATDAEVLVTANETPTVCPPALALQAIEKTLTPKKKSLYLKRLQEDFDCQHDHIYNTWKYLKKSIVESSCKKTQESVLVTSGIIPKALEDIFPEVRQHKRQTVRLGKRVTSQTRVLTGDEIATELRKKEEDKQRLKMQKEQRKLQRQMRKQTKQLPNTKKRNTRKNQKMNKKLKTEAEYEDLCKQLYSITSFDTLQETAKEIIRELPEVCLQKPIPHTNDLIDLISLNILKRIGDPDFDRLQPISVYGDGNCLPRTASLILYGNEDHHHEMRLRIGLEAVLHAEKYLNDTFLAQGMSSLADSPLAKTYAMFSDHFDVSITPTLDLSSLKYIYEKETKEIFHSFTYMGMWQIHALASVFGCVIQSVYPGHVFGSVTPYLNRVVNPIQLRSSDKVFILWTSTTAQKSKWFQPNHFVPLLQLPLETSCHATTGSPGVEPPVTHSDVIVNVNDTAETMKSTEIPITAHLDSTSLCVGATDQDFYVNPQTGILEKLNIDSKKPTFDETSVTVQATSTTSYQSVEDYYCIFCGEKYAEPIAEDWIECPKCGKWCHENCANPESVAQNFVCDFCI